MEWQRGLLVSPVSGDDFFRQRRIDNLLFLCGRAD